MSSTIDLLNVPIEKRTRAHLVEMLRCAIKLEHATLPPYLTAMWSIREKSHPAYEILRSVVYEEMGHMGTACNLLTTIGGSPAFNDHDFIPRYPGPLPCDIAPRITPPNLIEWKVGLSRLTPAVVSEIFMIIEYPEKGPAQTIEFGTAKARRRFHTIGEFYDAIADTLKHLVTAQKVQITGQRQLSEPFTGHDENQQNVLKPITTLQEGLYAIEHIKEQGEGTPSTPDAPTFGNELAHYYKFKQIEVGRNFAQMADKSWTLTGDFFDFPSVYPMADIPATGRTPPKPVDDKIKQFNNEYRTMLACLQSAWDKGDSGGGQDDLAGAKEIMLGLGRIAVDLMKNEPIDVNDPSKGYYGPTFQIYEAEANSFVG
ncbi:ferritin-like domain-containing protein [Mesorhizobium loti]|uniref:ferritin-like domain-containing protein n=1 Tax=Rhizobium loti TaxID=381 RepID=UPI0003FD4D26|nr:ferritin-like protein [Mesorhizobium loti]